MRNSVFLLPKAEADIDSHCGFLAMRDPEKAIAFYDAVFSTLDFLCDSPNIGSERAFMNKELFGLRMWFVKGFEKHLIFYRPFGNYIEVVRVLHSSQDRDVILLESE